MRENLQHVFNHKFLNDTVVSPRSHIYFSSKPNKIKCFRVYLHLLFVYYVLKFQFILKLLARFLKKSLALIKEVRLGSRKIKNIGLLEQKFWKIPTTRDSHQSNISVAPLTMCKLESWINKYINVEKTKLRIKKYVIPIGYTKKVMSKFIVKNYYNKVTSS